MSLLQTARFIATPLAGIAFVAAAHATDAPPAPQADGYISTMACAELPRGLSFAVVPEDDSPESLEAGRHFEAAMRARGFDVPEDPRDGVLRIVYSIGRQQIANLADGPSLGRLGGSDADGVDFRVNLFSTGQDSIIGGRRSRTDQFETYLRIVARLDQPPIAERRGCIWRGEALARLDVADPAVVTRGAVDNLVAVFGETADRHPYTLP